MTSPNRDDDSLTTRLAGATQMDSVVQPFLIDYDSTQSLTLFDGEREVACCNLVPPFPDFPTEWSATVEANIVNDGYTYVQRELYSASQVRIIPAPLQHRPLTISRNARLQHGKQCAALLAVPVSQERHVGIVKACILLSTYSCRVAALCRKRCGWTCTRTTSTK